jgi:hypothetical protein
VSDRTPGRGFWIGVGLFALALALYARTGSFPFIEYDDPQYVRDNPHLVDGLSGETLRWALFSTDYQYNWHPLTWISHALDVELFGDDAGWHHLVNAVLHALNAVLVFVALRSLGLRDAVAGLTAAAFAVHPLRVESVAWISERKDLLAGAFFLVTLWAWGRYVRRPTRWRYGAVAAALVLGLGAKPTLVTLPFLLLLLDGWPLGRWRSATSSGSPPPPRSPSLAPTRPGKTIEPRSGRALVLEKLPLLLIVGLAVALTWKAQSSGGAVDARLSIAERLRHVPVAYLTYLRSLFLPTGLSVFHPHPGLVGQGTSAGAALGALAVLGILIGLVLRTLRRAPWFAVGLAWFLGVLVPMIGLVQVGEQSHAERYAYLSFLGPELALACALVTWAQVSPVRLRIASLLAVVGLGLLAATSVRRLADWSSSRRLFEAALTIDPDNHVAHNTLGLLDGADGDLDGALAHFEAARAEFPAFYAALINVGKARYQRQEIELALQAFDEAVRARPAAPEARLFHGITLAAQGRFLEADAELDRARDLEPRIVDDPLYRSTRSALDRRLEEVPR